MAGGIFFLMGRQHLTADDGWIVSEIKEQKMRAAKMERGNKRWLGNHVMCKEVLPI